MIDFSLYPNLNGNLGENKVAIPDGVIVKWPDGDTMVGNFIYKDGKLSGFVDTKALIANESKTTTIPYDYFEAEMENVREDSVKFNLGERCKKFTLKLMPKYKGCKTINGIKTIDENYIENDIVDGVWSKDLEDLENGEILFKNCLALESFTGDLKSLIIGQNMFEGCTNLTSFISDLKSINVGYQMFHNCSSLITFTSDLSSLTNGNGMFSGCSNINTFGCLNLKSLIEGQSMFYNCKNLTSVTFNLKSLIYGGDMFAWCERLITFNSDLSSLADGNYMFYNCKNLTSFDSNLSSLTRGDNMFEGCSKLSSFKLNLNMLTNGSRMFVGCNNLTSFKSNLSSLTSGDYMFYGCKLDTNSIKNIAETINTVTNTPVIRIGIGNKTPTEEENTYLTQIHNKGWQVYVNGAGNAYEPTDNTSLIPIDGEQNLNPIPFWAKPVPSTEEEANYIDENGNFFNILGGQFIYVNDPETYGMFISEEDAAMQMRLIKIEKEEN